MRYLILAAMIFLGCGRAEAQEYPTGLVMKPGWSQTADFMEPPTYAKMPEYFSWTEFGLSPVKDQGPNCGSCWAFATVSVLEDTIRVKQNRMSYASEQFLLSCNPYGYSCAGGWWAHDMHVYPGAVAQNNFPYVGYQSPCPAGFPVSERIQSWKFVPGGTDNTPPSVEAIKSAIYTYGPVGAAVAADRYFMGYRRGIFSSCGSTVINHAVTLVGWGPGYWILKNSWGTKWGENGYMRILWGCNRVGVSSHFVLLGDSKGG